MGNRLSIAQTWGGIDESRKLTKKFEEESGQNVFVSLILGFVSKRVEATGLRDYLKSELTQLLQRFKQNEDVETYLQTKLFGLWGISTSKAPATLFFDAQASIIDHYETLVCILQSAASDKTIPSNFIEKLKRPLLALEKQTGDARLFGVMRGLGIVPACDFTINPTRAEIIECYTTGNYEAALRLAEPYLSLFPEDLAIHVIEAKSAIHGGHPIPRKFGVLAEVTRGISEILTASTTVYTSAFALITLCERYYGQSWVAHLRAIVMYELREETATFPPTWFRDIYVRDQYISPFSAAAAEGDAKAALLSNPEIAALYPKTMTVFNAVTTGDPSGGDIGKGRLRRYVGRFHLVYGDPKVAIECFSSQGGLVLPSDRLRFAGSLSLAHLKAGDIKSAVEVSVGAILSNPNAPTLLPIETLVSNLENPADWPVCISLALLFQIYSEYIDNDRLAHLRIAFELFQVKHDISQPNDLVDAIDTHGRMQVIAYLDQVWRPEVMRQTVIYGGTREIEEARIKVCQVLAELDPKNSTKYLEEIKDRVKQQEIAKGTTLIEQSRVYVDIRAIRKSLRSKLGDSYARYKSMQQEKSDTLLYKLTEAIEHRLDVRTISISKYLSTIHLLHSGETITESDVQFDALFSEITNEFLRGDHGLNAYLSTRVRHGTLANTLRKPVADENLVTSKGGDGQYLENVFWKSKAEYDSHEVWPAILDALKRFALAFDGIIDHVKDDLLQIRVMRDLKAPAENDMALFVYRSSNLERRFFQESARNVADIDDLVAKCLDSLWEKTDDNLVVVQKTLESSIREKLAHSFDDLSDYLMTVSFVPGTSDLLNAIARARTGTQVKLGQVISWFKRSEVYDRQDYLPELAVQISQNMVSSTISDASNLQRLEILVDSDGSCLPGRTLDGIVDVFYFLFENAIRHSGVAMTNLIIENRIAFRDGRYFASVLNNVDTSRNTDECRAKLDEIRSSLSHSGSRRIAQSEGRSGLHKVWLALNSPSFNDPQLNFIN